MFRIPFLVLIPWLTSLVNGYLLSGREKQKHLKTLKQPGVMKIKRCKPGHSIFRSMVVSLETKLKQPDSFVLNKLMGNGGLWILKDTYFSPPEPPALHPVLNL